MAFYTLLSLTPLFVIIVTVAGLAYGTAAAQGQLAWQLRELIGPEGAQALQALAQGVQKPATGVIAAGFGLALLMFGASSVVVELRDALNTIWRVPGAGSGSGFEGIVQLVRDRFYSFALVIGAGLLLVASLAVNTWIAMLGTFLGPVATEPGFMTRIAAFLASFLVTTVLFGAIYRALPDVHLEWRDVAVGALVTSLLFSAGNQLIGLYLGRAGLGSAYGAAGSLVVVLVWVYYGAQVFFLGAEFTKVYSRTFGSHLGAAT